MVGEFKALWIASDVDGRAVQGRGDRLTGPAVFVMLQRGQKSLAKYGKSSLASTGIKKLVGRDKLINLLNSYASMRTGCA